MPGLCEAGDFVVLVAAAREFGVAALVEFGEGVLVFGDKIAIPNPTAKAGSIFDRQFVCRDVRRANFRDIHKACERVAATWHAQDDVGPNTAKASRHRSREPGDSIAHSVVAAQDDQILLVGGLHADQHAIDAGRLPSGETLVIAIPWIALNADFQVARPRFETSATGLEHASNAIGIPQGWSAAAKVNRYEFFAIKARGLMRKLRQDGFEICLMWRLLALACNGDRKITVGTAVATPRKMYIDAESHV